ncbi:MAG: hypothetical protein JKX90_02910 [Colwellia sp.]|jgi:hypothetical protein|nr:hypothetical protein [Colwellia sp.]
MNIKEHIDSFNEISHLKREEQFVLLRQAKNEACSKLKPLNFSIIAFFVRMIFIVIIFGCGYLFFDYSNLLVIVSIFLGLLFSRVAISEINTYLLSKSLNNILLK